MPFSDTSSFFVTQAYPKGPVKAITNTTKAVSYTHLDVYKRQLIGRAGDDFPGNDPKVCRFQIPQQRVSVCHLKHSMVIPIGKFFIDLEPGDFCLLYTSLSGCGHDLAGNAGSGVLRKTGIYHRVRDGVAELVGMSLGRCV